MKHKKPNSKNIHHRADPSPRPAIWPWIRRHIIALIVLAFPMYFASHQLAHLGGSALWLPPEWRGGVNALGTALGLMVFALVRGDIRSRPPQSRSAQSDASGEEPEQVRKESHNLRKAIACLFLTTILFTAYYGLRAACVFSWPGANEWVAENLGNQTGTTASEPNSHETPSPDTIAEVPTFLDLGRSEILIPAWPLRPPCLRYYFEQIAQDPQNAGLGGPVTQVLDREPDTIIDCLRDDGRMYLYLQIIPFLLLYLGIMASSGAFIGFPFRSGEALGEMITSIVR